ncbi:RNA-binding S4 domain-containing protein [Pyruvatibacter sp.]|uniref:RNA-binding S4 domain-containing protein n=1 Tax=Pyruvatibacter sp. TaxID=1981328 RepID=UPI0032668056
MGTKSDDQDIRQRIDRWMWCARFFKTRSIAARFVGTGKVRVNGTRVTKAAHQVRPGDVLTFPLGDRIRVIEVTAFVEKRGSATIAATLYDDQSPPPPPKGKDKPKAVNPSPEAAPDSRARAKLRELKAQ